MKNLSLSLIILCWAAKIAFAQIRYSEEIFTSVKLSADVIYGGNGTILHFPENGGDIIYQDLLMDIYEPIGDTLMERPLVLVFHEGNFLPPVINGQITGSRKDSSCVEICQQLARRGFTAASVSYRLGWNPLALTQAERALLFIQALYRGIQDGRTAIRFFRKSHAEQNNPHQIDPDRITVWGLGPSGTFGGYLGGAYLTLGMVGLSTTEEIISTTHPPEKYLLDLDGDGVLETPMVMEALHGDLEGKFTTVVPENNLGLIAGDTSNYENHPEFSSDFHLAVNIGGAIADISWLNDNEVPIIAVQSTYDPISPYDDQWLIIHSGGGSPIIRVQGAKLIGEWMDSSGLNQDWINLGLTDTITLEAESNALIYGGHTYYEGIYSFYNPPNSNGADEGVVVNWWDPNALGPLSSPCEGLAWNACLHPLGVSYHELALYNNEGMSAEKARANLSKVMDYVIPRACVTLDLDCGIITATENIDPENPDISIFPNPTNNQINISSTTINPIRKIEIFNTQGILLLSESFANQIQVNLDIDLKTQGLYWIRIYTPVGIVVKQIMVSRT